MNPRVAVLGEVEENPLVLGFDEMQARLVAVLDDLNREHADALAAPLVTSSGFPEFSGVLVDLSPAYPLARRLAEEFHPLPVHVAATRGEVLPWPEEPEADQLEGPAFDLAAELLYRARKEDRLLLVHGRGRDLDALANALCLVLYRDMQRWTGRQCEVVRLYRTLRRQRAVAEALGITQQSVSGSLSAAGWKTMEEAEACLREVLGPVR